jgi:hypothetical protein
MLKAAWPRHRFGTDAAPSDVIAARTSDPADAGPDPLGKTHEDVRS